VHARGDARGDHVTEEHGEPDDPLEDMAEPWLRWEVAMPGCIEATRRPARP
jgi:hypothetical protein